MNNNFSSGAFQQDDELVLQSTLFSFIPGQNSIQEEFVINNSYTSLNPSNNSMDIIGSGLTIDDKGKRQRKSSSFQDDGENKGNGKQLKILHRDIERQRRQEMANLHASLRMQLPLEYIKGKRSVSDLIHETENYIKHKEKNIEELKAKRDTLKNFKDRMDINSTNRSSSSSDHLPIDVTVGLNLSGVEILISVDLRNNIFALSRVLERLISKGLNVISCVCTQANGRILHSIQTEAGHLGEIEIQKLHQEVCNFVNTSSKASSGSETMNN